VEKVIIDGNNLRIEDIVNVSRKFYRVELSRESMENIKSSRELVDAYLDRGEIQYGITTGFGKFSDVVISKEESMLLQRNLIVSHACGVGNPLDEEIVRAMMLLRVNLIMKYVQ
jgi:histidine ammonia-lyase